jgi:hypothetical protein
LGTVPLLHSGYLTPIKHRAIQQTLKTVRPTETRTRSLRTLAQPRVLVVSCISMVLFAALLLPRAAQSRFLPLPTFDHDQLAEIDRRELERFVLSQPDVVGATHGAQPKQLSVGVRTIGELFRRTGTLLATGSPHAEAVLGDLRAQFRAEVERGHIDDILALRSLQSQLFVRALTGDLPSDVRKRELNELGGDLADLLERGWLGWDDEPRARSSVDPATLRLLFRVRWGLLVGAHRLPPFGPGLEELRAYYSVYLRYPPLTADDDLARALQRVRYAQALGEIDPEFPRDFALGSLFLQAEQRELAAPHLRAHLARHPNGPLALLAQSYLLFAVSEP